MAAFALLVAAGAVALFFVALQIHVREVDVLWGPRLFPVAVMAALALTGVSVAVLELFFSGNGERPAEPNDWKAMAFVLAGLLLFGMLVEPLRLHDRRRGLVRLRVARIWIGTARA